MKTKYIFVLAILCVITNTFSQTSLNAYKYVIVPNQFNFQKSPNQYQLNRLTKFLFNKYGFNVVYEGEELPSDLKSNYCLALNSNIESVGFFNTKTIMTLIDCNGKVIFTTKEAFTLEKDFKKAYTLTIREVFKSLDSINYIYTPNKNDTSQVSKTNVTKNQEVEKLKEEIKTLKEKNAVNKNIAKAEVEQNIKKKEITETKKEVEKVKIPKENSSKILYAQEIENGFQVVDATPKVVMILLKTPKKDTFIVKARDAIVYKEDGFWYISENSGINTTTKILNIKF